VLSPIKKFLATPLQITEAINCQLNFCSSATVGTENLKFTILIDSDQVSKRKVLLLFGVKKATAGR